MRGWARRTRPATGRRRSPPPCQTPIRSCVPFRAYWLSSPPHHKVQDHRRAEAETAVRQPARVIGGHAARHRGLENGLLLLLRLSDGRSELAVVLDVLPVVDHL